MTANEFYDEFLKNTEDGELSSYPVEESAIRAFGLTEKDLEPYIDNPSYYGKHWLEILKDVLKNKGELID